jgi:hypothetical protein
MTVDPQGLYARLEVDPSAPHEAIVASYRRLARVLHPDVAGTGNADAFILIHQAYEVLADPLQRAAYDRVARQAAVPAARPTVMDQAMAEQAAADEAVSEMVRPEERPRWSDLPLAVWLGLLGVIGVAGVVAMVQLADRLDDAPLPPARGQNIALPHAAPPVPTVKPVGTPTHYVLPTAGPAMVWRFDPAVGHYVAIGQLEPFSAVRALHAEPHDGMLEIALDGGTSGFVDATRLMPGDQLAARHAYCIDIAGAPPVNGEVLLRHGAGAARVQIENDAELSSVVKLRATDGSVAAKVFLAPHGSTVVDQLPAGSYRPEFASGELWSRGCGGFVAGMRAERFASTVELGGDSRLAVPPGLSGAAMPVDIPDATFERD